MCRKPIRVPGSTALVQNSASCCELYRRIIQEEDCFVNKQNRVSFWQTLKTSLVSDGVFRDNEVAANLLTARIMVLNSVVLILSCILNEVGVYALDRAEFRSITVWSTIELLAPALLCRYFHGEKRWLKYLMIIELTIVLARIDSLLTYHVPLIMVIPIVLTARYYSGAFTRQIAILTTVLFGISAYCSAQFEMGQYNLMFQAADKATYVRNIMLHSFLPKWFVFILLSIACIELAKWGRRMVLDQAKISQEHSRVETELDMARRIQNRALPIVHTLPQQESQTFDLAAVMTPAKEVGGDFYDFFYLDPTHLVLMIADVSGKGVPAALFMMASKLLLDNSITAGNSPGQVLAEVNRQLCEKNLENMFVTVWLGILDLESGDMVTANAGHEYPLICRKDGTFEVIKDKHGFVLGGAEGMRYREMTLHLDSGDILFVYTDGVPEANNTAGDQFGMERTVRTLNEHRACTMEALLTAVKTDIAEFADGAPQFDDTTMLAFRMADFVPTDGICTGAEQDSIEKVGDYVRGVMDAAGVPTRFANRINIAVDEVYSNIVNYSGAAWAGVTCTADGGCITVKFRDNGTRFDPTQMEDPDVAAALDDRDMGGLGIYMTKRLMDSVVYSRKQGKNILVLQLKYAQ